MDKEEIHPVPSMSTKKKKREETLECGTETGFMQANASFSFLSLWFSDMGKTNFLHNFG